MHTCIYSYTYMCTYPHVASPSVLPLPLPSTCHSINNKTPLYTWFLARYLGQAGSNNLPANIEVLLVPSTMTPSLPISPQDERNKVAMQGNRHPRRENAS